MRDELKKQEVSQSGKYQSLDDKDKKGKKGENFEDGFDERIVRMDILRIEIATTTLYHQQKQTDDDDREREERKREAFVFLSKLGTFPNSNPV